MSKNCTDCCHCIIADNPSETDIQRSKLYKCGYLSKRPYIRIKRAEECLFFKSNIEGEE